MIAINDLGALQVDVASWAIRNFPDAQPHQPLLGVMEEGGELCHAHLKMEQRIRGNEDLKAKQIDAVGDIVIFLAHYCTLNSIDLSSAVSDTWAKVKQRDWKRNPNQGEP